MAKDDRRRAIAGPRCAAAADVPLGTFLGATISRTSSPYPRRRRAQSPPPEADLASLSTSERTMLSTACGWPPQQRYTG